MGRSVPEWFPLSEQVTPIVMERIACAVSKNSMALQVKSSPLLAHWFVLDSLYIANKSNRDGMHANALALTRQCIEAISVIELGICLHPEAEAQLLRWEADKMNAGQVRAWLQDNVWPQYGNGLWSETWSIFMREFAKAIQPYAHYSRSLAQWQLRLHGLHDTSSETDPSLSAIIEVRPRAYDPQKATRITLFHALLTYLLGRVSMDADRNDLKFAALVTRLGVALGKSRYLDGRDTNWSEQFWAMVWVGGNPNFE